MTEPHQSQTDAGGLGVTRESAERATRYDRADHAHSIVVWVGIVAGVVFIVAIVFFSGFVIGRSSAGHWRFGHDGNGMMYPGMMYPGMMYPGQPGPHGPMGPGMMGPNGPWGPGQQSPTAPRP